MGMIKMTNEQTHKRLNDVMRQDLIVMNDFAKIMHKLVITSELSSDEETALEDILGIQEECEDAYNKVSEITSSSSDEDIEEAHKIKSDAIKQMKVIVDKYYHIIINNH